MDVQPGIVERIEAKDSYLKKLNKLIDRAHLSEIMVIFVVVGFRPGFPEISSTNKSFADVKRSYRESMITPVPAIQLQEQDILVTKHRVSAFSGSDLEMILNANHVNHLILTGIATSGVVLSTLREAADKDYQLTVVEDLCVDFDPDIQQLLINKLFPRQANIVSSDSLSFD